MSEERITDEMLDVLATELRQFEGEEYYWTFHEKNRPLAARIDPALRNGNWTWGTEIVIEDASISNRPEVQIETQAIEPEGGVRVLLEWLKERGYSASHNFNPDINEVAIHVDV